MENLPQWPSQSKLLFFSIYILKVVIERFVHESFRAAKKNIKPENMAKIDFYVFGSVMLSIGATLTLKVKSAKSCCFCEY